MLTRSTRSMVTFDNAFRLDGYQHPFPSGAYEIVVEEELLQGVSFEAYRRTATFLTVQGGGGRSGHTTLHMTTREDLEHAIACDQNPRETT